MGIDTGSIASRFRQAEEVADVYTAITEQQLEDDQSRWSALAVTGAKMASALKNASTDPFALMEPAKGVFNALLDVEEAQERLLASIDDNVRLLLDGPFNTGRLYLHEAHRVIERPQRCATFLERAEDSFYRARATAAEPLDQASVEMHLGLVAMLQQFDEDARHWFRSAHLKATLRAQELAEMTGDTKVIKGRGIAQGVTAYFTLGTSAAFLAAKKYKQVRSNKRARDGLRTTLPLVACLAALHDAHRVDEPPLPILQLVPAGKERFELIVAGLGSTVASPSPALLPPPPPGALSPPAPASLDG